MGEKEEEEKRELNYRFLQEGYVVWWAFTSSFRSQSKKTSDHFISHMAITFADMQYFGIWDVIYLNNVMLFWAINKEGATKNSFRNVYGALFGLKNMVSGFRSD